MITWIDAPLACLAPGDQAVAGIVVEDTLIRDVLHPGDPPPDAFDERLDARELVVLPGLVNTHHHYYQTLTRGHPAALDKELFPWLKALYPVWAKLTPEMVDLSTRIAAAELLLSGCTTSADHHYLYSDAIPDAFDIQANAVRHMGIRSVLTRGSMSLGEDQGGLPPRSVVQDEDTILADCERLISRHHDPEYGAMLQVALAPCSPFSVTPNLMTRTAELARSRGVRLHTHLAETLDENDYCLRATGMRPLDLLDTVGWLTDDVWLAHGIHFDDEEIERLGRAGTGIAHCPSSNMVLASGICRTRELEATGAPVGLAVDGSASNDASNMIQECRQALLINRLRYGAAKVSHRDALRWATTGSARCLGRDDIGAIAPGKAADLSLFRLDETRFSGAGDPLASLLLCGAHGAEHVMVNGTWKVRGGELEGVDLARLNAEHHASARTLLPS